MALIRRNEGRDSRSLINNTETPDNLYQQVTDLQRKPPFSSIGLVSPGFGSNLLPEKPIVDQVTPHAVWNGTAYMLSMQVVLAYDATNTYEGLDTEIAAMDGSPGFDIVVPNREVPFSEVYTVSDVGFILGATYQVRVRTYDSQHGRGNWSDWYTGVAFNETSLSLPDPPTITGLCANAWGDYGYHYTDAGVEACVTFTLPAGAQKVTRFYYEWWPTSDMSAYQVGTTYAEAPAFYPDRMTPGVEYTLRIRGEQGGVPGGWSASFTWTPPTIQAPVITGLCPNAWGDYGYHYTDAGVEACVGITSPSATQTISRRYYEWWPTSAPANVLVGTTYAEATAFYPNRMTPGVSYTMRIRDEREGIVEGAWSTPFIWTAPIIEAPVITALCANAWGAYGYHYADGGVEACVLFTTSQRAGVVTRFYYEWWPTSDMSAYQVGTTYAEAPAFYPSNMIAGVEYTMRIRGEWGSSVFSAWSGYFVWTAPAVPDLPVPSITGLCSNAWATYGYHYIEAGVEACILFTSPSESPPVGIPPITRFYYEWWPTSTPANIQSGTTYVGAPAFYPNKMTAGVAYTMRIRAEREGIIAGAWSATFAWTAPAIQAPVISGLCSNAWGAYGYHYTDAGVEACINFTAPASVVELLTRFYYEWWPTSTPANIQVGTTYVEAPAFYPNRMTPGTEYTIRIRAESQGVPEGAWSTSFVWTPPLIPEPSITGLCANAWGAFGYHYTEDGVEACVGFTPPPSGGQTIDRFYYEWWPTGNMSAYRVGTTYVEAPAFYPNNMVPGTQYTMRIRAEREGVIVGAWSAYFLWTAPLVPSPTISASVPVWVESSRQWKYRFSWLDVWGGDYYNLWLNISEISTTPSSINTVDTYLSPGVAYDFYMTASSGVLTDNVESLPSNHIIDTTPVMPPVGPPVLAIPAAPVWLENIGQWKYTLVWTASTSLDIWVYNLRNGDAVVTSSTDLTVDTFLLENTAYDFAIEALNSNYRWSVPSNRKTGTSPAAPVVAPPVLATPAAPVWMSEMQQWRYTLVWTASSSPDMGVYDLWNNGAGISSSATLTIYTFVPPNTGYDFSIKAVNNYGRGSVLSNHKTGTAPAAPTLTAPSAPTIGTMGGTVLSGFARASWTYTSNTREDSHRTGFYVEYWPTGGTTRQIQVSVLTDIVTMLAPLTPGEWNCRVKAVSKYGGGSDSPFSTPTVFTFAAPAEGWRGSWAIRDDGSLAGWTVYAPLTSGTLTSKGVITTDLVSGENNLELVLANNSQIAYLSDPIKLDANTPVFGAGAARVTVGGAGTAAEIRDFVLYYDNSNSGTYANSLAIVDRNLIISQGWNFYYQGDNISGSAGPPISPPAGTVYGRRLIHVINRYTTQPATVRVAYPQLQIAVTGPQVANVFNPVTAATFKPTSGGITPMTAQAASGQTSAILDVQNSAGSPQLRVASAGEVQMFSGARMNNNTLVQLRDGTDVAHNIGYNSTPDGPRMSGYNGGDLWTANGNKRVAGWNTGEGLQILNDAGTTEYQSGVRRLRRTSGPSWPAGPVGGDIHYNTGLSMWAVYLGNPNYFWVSVHRYAVSAAVPYALTFNPNFGDWVGELQMTDNYRWFLDGSVWSYRPIGAQSTAGYWTVELRYLDTGVTRFVSNSSGYSGGALSRFRKAENGSGAYTYSSNLGLGVYLSNNNNPSLPPSITNLTFTQWVRDILS